MVETVTVGHPGRYSDVDASMRAAQLKARNVVLEETVAKLIHDLAAIHDSIKRGEQVDLIYPDGEVITITRARKRTAGDDAS